ncbi:MAG: V-type ATP synthase subunit I [Firmicutes bacterium]|jgi:V/A-type H+-transporting ATPase subunit I|nr:V-type ATP synthase subunit I [Bacillota bacterium]
MAVAKMKKVFLMAHREDREALTKVLQRLGVLQLEDFLLTKECAPETEVEVYLKRDEPGEEAAALDARIADLKFCLDFMQRLSPEKTSFIQQFAGTKVYLKERDFRECVKESHKVDSVHKGLRLIDAELTRLRNEETKNHNLLAQLEPWLALDVPLEELTSGSDIGVEVGTLPLTAQKETEWLEELEAASPGAYVEIVGRNREEVYLVLLYAREDEEFVQSLLRQRSFGRATFPSVQGTAQEVKERCEKELARLAARREKLLAEARQYLEHRLLVKSAYDEAAMARSRLEAVLNFGRTAETFALTGWVEAENLPRLEKAVASVSPTAYLKGRDPTEDDDPPVILENSRSVYPFEVVTELYGLPLPRGVDPTPYVAPFFFLFFGLMYGDAGYGLVLMGLAWLTMRKIRMAGMAKKLFILLMLGGAASVLVGAVTGSWFGDLPLPTIWFSPADDPMKMLIISFALGLVHIYTGLIIQMITNLRSGKVADGLFDQGLWLVFLTGLVMFGVGTVFPAITPIGKIVAIVGAVGLVLTQGRANKNVIKRLLSGILSLYDVSGYLSDVLSYSRLLALGLGTSVIGTVINSMVALVAAGGPIGWIIGAIIAVVGHAFNLIINVLGAYVHASRLQYVEFFTKFYESGGRAFNPFRMMTRYIDLELEEREA